MRCRKLAKYVGIALCAIPFSFAQTFARADVIGAEQYVNVIDRRATIDRINVTLARADVRQELERHGVDPDDATARVAALSDQELVQLAEDFEALPAGGDLLAVVGITFIVLLILELVGVIDIFKKT